MVDDRKDWIDLDDPIWDDEDDEEQEEATADLEDGRDCPSEDANEDSDGSQTPEAQECDTKRQNETRPLRLNQVRVLELLANGSTVSDAGKDALVHRSTIHRWLKDDPDFVNQLALYEEEIKHEIRARTLSLVCSGLATLEEIFDFEENYKFKLAALKAINIGALMKLTFGKTREIKPTSRSGKDDSGKNVIPDVTEGTEDED